MIATLAGVYIKPEIWFMY